MTSARQALAAPGFDCLHIAADTLSKMAFPLEEVPPRVFRTRDLIGNGDLLSPLTARALHELLLLLPLRGE